MAVKQNRKKKPFEYKNANDLLLIFGMHKKDADKLISVMPWLDDFLALDYQLPLMLRQVLADITIRMHANPHPDIAKSWTLLYRLALEIEQDRDITIDTNEDGLKWEPLI